MKIKNLILNLKILFVFVLFSINSVLYAQNKTIKGIITDSLANPLPYANVIAVPFVDGGEMKFSITDEKGRYKMLLNSDLNYNVSVSYIGYLKFSFNILSVDNNSDYNIKLRQSEKQLDEVIIIEKMPVLIKEDTIIYNTNSFTTGEERKLKDVLSKLPGVDVDNNSSNVTVNGKIVTTMLVEGKKFFDGGTKLAIENIPANSIDKVEVIDNYNSVSFLKGFNETDKLVMNIKLKKDKKNFAFGEIEIGAANEEHHLAHSNLFYYSPKNNFNFIGDLNNVSKNFFTYEDYYRFEGGNNTYFKGDNSIFNLSASNLNEFVNNKNVFERVNKFAAFNYTQTINSKIDLSGYAILSDYKTNSLNEIYKKYFFSDLSYNENINSFIENNNKLSIGKLIFDYYPNDNVKIFLKSQGKISNQSILNSQLSEIELVKNEDVENSASNLVQLKQNFEFHNRLSKKHAISLGIDFAYQKNTNKNIWTIDIPIIENLIPLIPENSYLINQSSKTKSNNLDIVFNHYWILTNLSHLYTTIGNNYINQEYITDENQELFNDDINDFSNSGFDNNLKLNFNDLYFGLHYKIKIKKITFKTGAFAHFYKALISQENINKIEDYVILPDFVTEFKINKSENIKLKYIIKSKFLDVENYANKYILQNYNSVFRGNENIDNELYHSAVLSYFNFSIFKNVILYASLSYDYKINGVINKLITENNDYYIYPIMLKNPSNSWHFTGSLMKKIRKIRFETNVVFLMSNYKQDINSVLIKYENNSLILNPSVKSNFKKFPNIKIGYSWTYNTFKSNINRAIVFNNEPYIEINYDFLKGFILKTDLRYNTYKNISINEISTNINADASLYYNHIDKPWGFELSINNILNEKYQVSNFNNDFQSSKNVNYILQRLFLFKVSYKI
ncbi:MAG: carboxypeptidase-like regulatory domain-containing protein [Bacteroidales bacterium]|nr:carboxypeptidase-like regulatory domain-containing protein [Bacteroidales bacterium]MBN2756463.1 carboxypeptidase-like regulatory domain-containing protein [Bacteroidales bacterium]